MPAEGCRGVRILRAEDEDEVLDLVDGGEVDVLGGLGFGGAAVDFEGQRRVFAGEGPEDVTNSCVEVETACGKRENVRRDCCYLASQGRDSFLDLKGTIPTPVTQGGQSGQRRDVVGLTAQW